MKIGQWTMLYKVSEVELQEYKSEYYMVSQKLHCCTLQFSNSTSFLMLHFKQS